MCVWLPVDAERLPPSAAAHCALAFTTDPGPPSLMPPAIMQTSLSVTVSAAVLAVVVVVVMLPILAHT